MNSRKILIVAAITAGEEHLQEIVLDRMREAPTRFVLLVPATPPSAGLVWTEGEAQAMAAERMRNGLYHLRSTGAEVEGVLGDPRPLDAVGDMLMQERFNEIIVSTLPAGLSRWLGKDLPRTLRRRFKASVTHLVAPLPLRNGIEEGMRLSLAAI
jgi:hypothetical protein